MTEYGIADLRGRSDEVVTQRLIEIADKRFQKELIGQARDAGKLGEDYELPKHARNNTPQHVDRILSPYRERGHFQRFPFGTDLTEEEVVLKKALTVLKQTIGGGKLSLSSLSTIREVVSVPNSAERYLRRMSLAEPEGVGEKLMQRALVYGLSSIDVL